MSMVSLARRSYPSLISEGVIFGGLSAAFFGLLVGFPHTAPSALDRALMSDVQGLPWGRFSFIPRLGSDLGGGVYGTYLVPAMAGTFFAATRRWRLLGLLALIFVLHYVMISPKLFITAHRPSPDFGVQGAGGLESFPSGHVQWATSFYGFLAILAWRNTKGGVRWLIAGTFGAIVLGTMLGRMELGRHWPVDVTGGLLVGLIALRIVSLLHPARAPQAAATVGSQATPADSPVPLPG